MIPKTALSVMFLSDMCLLDRNSGAAIEMYDWLRLLAAEGYETSSVTMSLFDGAEEYPFRSEIVPNVDVPAHVGKRIRLSQDGIEHNIYNTGTSLATKLSQEMIRGFIASAAEDIRRLRPDVVIGYGSVNLIPLRRLARSLGARCVFYLANDSYNEEKRRCFEEIDVIVTPSQSLSDRYKERMGLDTVVIGNYLSGFTGLGHPALRDIDARRRGGLVTIVNPSLAKGGLVFLQVAAVLEKRMPELTFLAVESRVTRAQIERFVPNANKLENIWWLPRQAKMHPVYRRSALLLVPSLCFEAAGRIVPEAQLHGVPVLAHRKGALPEQLGKGGELIDAPNRIDDGVFATLPTPEEVAPWVSAIRRSLEHARYHKLSRNALVAAERHRPELRAQEILAFFAQQVSTSRDSEKTLAAS